MRQFGSYLPLEHIGELRELTLVREDWVGSTYGVSVVTPVAAPSSYVDIGELLKASKRETLLKTDSHNGERPSLR